VSDAPRIERVRHELRRRRLQVLRVERIAPTLTRVVLGGAELAGFTSLGFDDHVKLIFPAKAGGEPAMRDFTPRRYDAAKGELSIDFFVHEVGPAAEWARDVKAGDALVVGGPKGSAVIAAEGIAVHVLIGDETAVPAMARRLEELPRDARAVLFVEGASAQPWLDFGSRENVDIHWVAREARGEEAGTAVTDALRRAGPMPPRTFFWIATESRVARGLRRFLREERGVDLAWIKASGYWQRGATGTHEKIADEA